MASQHLGVFFARGFLLVCGACGRNPLAGVRLLPPAGYAVVGALRAPFPLPLVSG
jgi:hypothetical protein